MLQTHSVGAGRQAFRTQTLRRTATVRTYIETVVFALAFGFTAALVFGLIP